MMSVHDNTDLVAWLWIVSKTCIYVHVYQHLSRFYEEKRCAHSTKPVQWYVVYKNSCGFKKKSYGWTFKGATCQCNLCRYSLYMIIPFQGKVEDLLPSNQKNLVKSFEDKIIYLALSQGRQTGWTLLIEARGRRGDPPMFGLSSFVDSNRSPW